MSFLKDFKSSFSGEQETPQEVEMNPLEDVWSNMKATASSAIDSAKKTTTKFKNTAVPTSEEDGTLESAWSKMTKQATAAAKSAKKSVAPMAATAGINLTINEDEKNEGDEENLMSGASDAANGLSEEMNGICPALTYKQRIYGALGCIGLGLLLDVFASLACMSRFILLLSISICAYFYIYSHSIIFVLNQFGWVKRMSQTMQ